MELERASNLDEVQVEYLDIEKVEVAFDNPKNHDIPNLVASIRRYGFVMPGCLDETTGRIVAGHGRRKALLQMKQDGEDVPRRIKTAPDGGWLMPFIRNVEFYDELEASSYLLTDNKLTEQGGWDKESLNALVARLDEAGRLVGTGFDPRNELNDLATRYETEEATPAEVTTNAIEFNPKYGQIWAVISPDDTNVSRTHKILFGDSTKDLHIFNRSFDGIFTSPPYAEQRKSTYGGISVADYVPWFDLIQKQLKSVLKPSGSFLLNIKPHTDSSNNQRSLYVNKLVCAMVEVWGWMFIDELIWVKSNPIPGKYDRRLKNAFEPVYHFTKTLDITFCPENAVSTDLSDYTQQELMDESEEDVKRRFKDTRKTVSGSPFTASKSGVRESILRNGGVLPSNVYTGPGDANSKDHFHPATFPSDLVEHFMKIFSTSASYWLDPFGGSGTSIIAAEKIERTCYIVEKNVEDYGEKILNRLSRAGFNVSLFADADETEITQIQEVKTEKKSKGK